MYTLSIIRWAKCPHFLPKPLIKHTNTIIIFMHVFFFFLPLNITQTDQCINAKNKLYQCLTFSIKQLRSYYYIHATI